LLLWYVRKQQKYVAYWWCVAYFLDRMQQDDHNADDVAASERARQRAKRLQKTHAKKSKD
jgi:hypothetical protein